MNIDFAQIKIAATANAEALLSEWYPNGTKRGSEFCIGDAYGSPGQSLQFNLRKGVGSDFASGFSGDIIDLLAEKESISKLEAAKQIADRLKIGSLDANAPRGSYKSKGGYDEDVEPTLDVPDSAPMPPEEHPTLGVATTTWTYFNEDGDPVGYIRRFDQEGGKKMVIPQCWCRNKKTKSEGWEWKSFPKPRPIYGLEQIASNPDKKIVIVEGEKAADACRRIAPNATVVSWPGGTNAVRFVDWSPLEDRVVIIWPDEDHQVYSPSDIPAKGFKVGDEKAKEDQPGYKAALAIKEILPHARIVETNGKHSDGWDAADAEGQGATIASTEEFLGIFEAEEQGGYVPTNRQMERAVLHGILHEDAMGHILAEGGCVGWFTEKDHKTIWKAAEAIFDHRGDVDSVLMRSELDSMIEADMWSGDSSQLVGSIKSEGRKYQTYMDLVKEEYHKREILTLLQKGSRIASRPNSTFKDIANDVGPHLDRIFSLAVSNNGETTLERITSEIQRRKDELDGIVEDIPMDQIVHLGIGMTDKHLGYIDRRDRDNFIVVGAPTSTGKSALMRQIITENLEMHPDWVFAGFLLESSVEDFWHNAACSKVGIDTRSNKSMWTQEEKNTYMKYYEMLQTETEKRLWLMDDNATVSEIRNKLREIKSKCGRLDVVIVDYIQIVERERVSSPEAEVAEISRKLKQAQTYIGCPLFAGSQLNEDGRARESRSIENDATRLWILNRPKEDPNGSPQGDGFICESFYQTIQQKKFRNGAKCTLKLNFKVKSQRIEDWS